MWLTTSTWCPASLCLPPSVRPFPVTACHCCVSHNSPTFSRLHSPACLMQHTALFVAAAMPKTTLQFVQAIPGIIHRAPVNNNRTPGVVTADTSHWFALAPSSVGSTAGAAVSSHAGSAATSTNGAAAGSRKASATVRAQQGSSSSSGSFKPAANIGNQQQQRAGAAVFGGGGGVGSTAAADYVYGLSSGIASMSLGSQAPLASLPPPPSQKGRQQQKPKTAATGTSGAGGGSQFVAPLKGQGKKKKVVRTGK